MNFFLDSPAQEATRAPGLLSRGGLVAEPQGDPPPSRLRFGHELWQLTLGRLTEISGTGGGGGLTLAASFLRRAQGEGRSVLWLSARARPFYPPDMAQAGVRLERLPILFLPRPEEASLVATRLLASGGFDLLVWDLTSWRAGAPAPGTALLARMAALARHHQAIVMILTEKSQEQGSLGCLIGLRLQVEAQPGNPALLRVRVLKDKRGAVGEGKEWLWRCAVPDGLPPSAPLPHRRVG